jgi:hypothetical protein
LLCVYAKSSSVTHSPRINPGAFSREREIAAWFLCRFIFALRNLSNDEDAAILSLSAYSAALRRALASPASIFFIDESPILFEFDAIADPTQQAECLQNAAAQAKEHLLLGQEKELLQEAKKGLANQSVQHSLLRL